MTSHFEFYLNFLSNICLTFCYFSSEDLFTADRREKMTSGPHLRRKQSLESQLNFGIFQTQGPCATMEDTYKVIPFPIMKSYSRKLESIDEDDNEENHPSKKARVITKRHSSPEQTPSKEPASPIQSSEISSCLTTAISSTSESPHEHSPLFAMFAVYDGHGGTEAAEFVKKTLHSKIASQASFGTDTEKAIRDGFLETDEDYMALANQKGGRYDGCGKSEPLSRKDVFSRKIISRNYFFLQIFFQLYISL
jgi:hypothetical protein